MILNRTSIASFLLGIYYSFSILMLVHLIGINIGYPNNEGRYFYPSFKEYIDAYNSSSLIKVPNNQIIMVISVTLIFFIFGILFNKMLKITNTTQLHDETSKAIAWGARNFIFSGLIIACIVMISFLFITYRTDIDNVYLIDIHFSILLICLILLPFFLLNKKILGTDKIGKWYKPMWPGLSPLLICVTGLIITTAINLLLDEHTIILLIIWYAADSVVTAILLSIFVYRIPFSALGAEIKSRMNLQFVSAWILLYVKFLYYFAWFFPIAFLASFSQVFVYPVILNSARDTASIKLWPVINSLVVAFDFFEKHYYILLLPLFILPLLISGRFLIQIDTLMANKNAHTDAE